MFGMFGGMAPVDKHSMQVICAMRLLEDKKFDSDEALRIQESAALSGLQAGATEQTREQMVKETKDHFAKKRKDLARKFDEKKTRILRAGAGPYAKIVDGK